MRRAIIFKGNVNLTRDKFTGVKNQDTVKDLKFLAGIEYIIQGSVEGHESDLVVIDENGNFVAVSDQLEEMNKVEIISTPINGCESIFPISRLLTWYVSPLNIDKAMVDSIDKEEKKEMSIIEKIEEQIREMKEKGKTRGAVRISGISKEKLEEAMNTIDGKELFGKKITVEKVADKEELEDLFEGICDCENCDIEDCESHPNYEMDEEVCVDENGEISCPTDPEFEEVIEKIEFLDAMENFAEVIIQHVSNSVIKTDLLSAVNNTVRSVTNKLDENLPDMIPFSELEVVSDAFDELVDEIDNLNINNDNLNKELDAIANYLTEIEEAKEEKEMKKIKADADDIKRELNNIVDTLPEEALEKVAELLKSFNN